SISDGAPQLWEGRGNGFPGQGQGTRQPGDGEGRPSRGAGQGEGGSARGEGGRRRGTGRGPGRREAGQGHGREVPRHDRECQLQAGGGTRPHPQEVAPSPGPFRTHAGWQTPVSRREYETGV